MKFWIVGTDTDVGKTTVSAWICLHSKYSYWKPLQTGCNSAALFQDQQSDSCRVKNLSDAVVYPEAYVLKEPLSPYAAAVRENKVISTASIEIPDCDNLVIESAGGLMVPIADNELYVDFIKKTQFPVILVARSGLGTINHTCLSIEALRHRNIELLGVIVNGEKNMDNVDLIKKYTNVKILATLGKISKIEKQSLYEEDFPMELKKLLLK
jgi:dethiobiotin synthetase